DHLSISRENIDRLNSTIEAKERLVYVAGSGQLTAVGLNSIEDLKSLDSYEVSYAGDGRVAHALGILPDVSAYYVRCAHGDLARNAEVLNAIEDLVENGHTAKLPSQVPEDRAVPLADGARLHAQWKKERQEREREEDEALADLQRRLDRLTTVSRGAARGQSPPPHGSSAARGVEGPI